MDLDRTLSATFRNFSTLFLVVFALILPLHLVYGWMFQDVLAIRELHGAIAEFPSSRQVRGVGQADVTNAKLWFWILIALEIALLPLIVKACRAVLDQDESGEVTNARSALAAIRQRRSGSTGRPSTGAWLPALAVALVNAAAAEVTLVKVGDFVPGDVAFVALALASAVARSCGIPFLAVALASSGSTDTAGQQGVPDLY